MTHIFDLTEDILLEIVELLRLSGTNRRGGRAPERRASNRRLSNLSATCKLFNAVCAHRIFEKYRLVIRSDTDDPMNSQHDLTRYRKNQVEERLAHFRAKAPFVREVTICDQWSVDPNGPAFLPEGIVPDIVDALQLAVGIDCVTIESGTNAATATLPAVIWTCLCLRPLDVLVFSGNIRPPRGARPHPDVGKLRVSLFENGSAEFLNLVHPETLVLTYPNSDDVDDIPIAKFVPGAASANLRLVSMDITLPDTHTHAHAHSGVLFDFSSVPEATVKATFHLGTQYYLYIPNAWRDLKRRLPQIFAEDLRSYDVERTVQGAALYRPPLSALAAGWAPRCAAHRESEEEAAREMDKLRPVYFASFGLWSGAGWKNVREDDGSEDEDEDEDMEEDADEDIDEDEDMNEDEDMDEDDREYYDSQDAYAYDEAEDEDEDE